MKLHLDSVKPEKDPTQQVSGKQSIYSNSTVHESEKFGIYFVSILDHIPVRLNHMICQY